MGVFFGRGSKTGGFFRNFHSSFHFSGGPKGRPRKNRLRIQNTTPCAESRPQPRFSDELLGVLLSPETRRDPPIWLVTTSICLLRPVWRVWRTLTELRISGRSSDFLGRSSNFSPTGYSEFDFFSAQSSGVRICSPKISGREKKVLL